MMHSLTPKQYRTLVAGRDAAEEQLESARVLLQTLKSQLDSLLDSDDDAFDVLADLECAIMDAGAQVGKMVIR